MIACQNDPVAEWIDCEITCEESSQSCQSQSPARIDCASLWLTAGRVNKSDGAASRNFSAARRLPSPDTTSAVYACSLSIPRISYASGDSASVTELLMSICLMRMTLSRLLPSLEAMIMRHESRLGSTSFAPASDKYRVITKGFKDVCDEL